VIKKTVDLPDYPALHSAAMGWYESPSGASPAQFLLVRLPQAFLFIDTFALCERLKKRFSLPVMDRLSECGEVDDSPSWNCMALTILTIDTK